MTFHFIRIVQGNLRPGFTVPKSCLTYQWAIFEGKSCFIEEGLQMT
jgi:hypothetical protein